MKKRIRRTYRVAKYVIYKQTIIEPIDHLWTFIGAFLGISAIGIIQDTSFSKADNIFLIGSFGASAVLVFGSSNSPLAQPRNLIGGHIISAIIGVTIHLLIPNNLWLASALSVSLSIVAMQITRTMHPPGGATALIANIGSQRVKDLGYLFIISPVLTGVGLLFLTAIIINNIPKDRSYPAKK